MLLDKGKKVQWTFSKLLSIMEAYSAEDHFQEVKTVYLIERQKKILNLLLLGDGWMTGAQIGNQLGITDRTVRNDIRDINEELKEFPDTHIESIRGKGYILNSKSREAILEQVEQTNGNETTQGRLCNLALEILMAEDPVFLDDLEEEYYISRTTLEATIKNINEKCKETGNKMVVRHKKNAVQAVCSEQERRSLLRRFILVSKEHMGGSIKDEYGFLNQDITKKIMLNVRRALAKRCMQLTDQDMIEVVLYIYIQYMRIRQGNHLDEKSEKNGDMIPKTIGKITEELTKNVGAALGIEFTVEERYVLSMYLCGIRMMKTERFTRKEIEAIVEPRYLVIVEELLNDIKNEFMLDLTQDDELVVDLVLHIRFSIKAGSSSHQTNPLLDTMKNQYPFVFELSTYIFSRFYDALGVELNENQLGYIAAHLGAALERLENTKSSSDFKIAVCSNMSMSIVRLLMAKLHSLYTNRINITGPYPVYDMEHMLEETPSLILTTTSSNLFRSISVPVITISPILESADVLAINQMISKLKRDSIVFPLPDEIEHYFEDDLFFPQLEFETQEEVLSFLSEKIVEKGYASDELLANTMEREKIAPTTFANEIAMPHPMRMCAYKTVIAVATLKNPVFWGNLSARLIFMLVVRGSDMKYMNSFFDIVSNLVCDKKKVRKLTDEEKFQKFMEELL